MKIYNSTKTDIDTILNGHIEKLELTIGGEFVISLNNGYYLVLSDFTMCCETRYMVCYDPDLRYFLGSKIIKFTESPIKYLQDSQTNHEICFVTIHTNIGTIDLVNHNSHNGCYSGFDLNITIMDKLQ